MDYRGIAWSSTSYHRIRDCLEMVLNRKEYRGFLWNSVECNHIKGWSYWCTNRHPYAAPSVTHIGLRMLWKPLKTQPARSALRNPCEGCSFHDHSETEKLEKVASRSWSVLYLFCKAPVKSGRSYNYIKAFPGIHIWRTMFQVMSIWINRLWGIFVNENLFKKKQLSIP